MTLPMSEADLQKSVTDLATLCGWRWFHDQDSRRNKAGLPDLIMVRRETLIFAELKKKDGAVRRKQVEWLADLIRVARSSDAVRVFLWRPEDWHSGAIVRVLR